MIAYIIQPCVAAPHSANVMGQCHAAAEHHEGQGKQNDAKTPSERRRRMEGVGATPTRVVTHFGVFGSSPTRSASILKGTR